MTCFDLSLTTIRSKVWSKKWYKEKEVTQINVDKF